MRLQRQSNTCCHKSQRRGTDGDEPPVGEDTLVPFFSLFLICRLSKKMSVIDEHLPSVWKSGEDVGEESVTRWRPRLPLGRKKNPAAPSRQKHIHVQSRTSLVKIGSVC